MYYLFTLARRFFACVQQAGKEDNDILETKK